MSGSGYSMNPSPQSVTMGLQMDTFVPEWAHYCHSGTLTDLKTYTHIQTKNDG